jgi:hypothetical protein
VNFFMAVKWHSMRFSHEEYVGVQTGVILFFEKYVNRASVLCRGRLSMIR